MQCITHANYALFLRAFNYKIQHRQTKAYGNVDCLSRLPIAEKSKQKFNNMDAFEIQLIEEFPITMQQLVIETDHNPELQKIKNALQKVIIY